MTIEYLSKRFYYNPPHPILGGRDMATKSFYETMVIDTPEAAANLAKAIDDYEQYGAYQPGPTQGVCTDPEVIKKIKEAWQ